MLKVKWQNCIDVNWKMESVVHFVVKSHEIQEEIVKTWCVYLLFTIPFCPKSFVPLSVSAYTRVTQTTVVWFTSAQSPVIDGWRKRLSEVAHLLCHKARSFKMQHQQDSVNPWGIFCLLKFCHVLLLPKASWVFFWFFLLITGELFLCRPWKHFSGI